MSCGCATATRMFRHLSTPTVSRRLKQSTLRRSDKSHRASSPDGTGILDLATRKVCGMACHHAIRWSLTPPFHPYPASGAVILCHTALRLPRGSPAGRYPVRRSVLPGLSSCRSRGRHATEVPLSINTKAPFFRKGADVLTRNPLLCLAGCSPQSRVWYRAQRSAALFPGWPE